LGLFLPASGLAASAIAGVWIGFALPDTDFAATYLDATSTSEIDLDAFLPGAGFSSLADNGGTE
jgi:hypothetical protein